MTLHPEYVVDHRGERKSVLLPIDEFRQLVEMLEDQLDAADLDRAVETERDFVPYERVRDELRTEDGP